MRKKAWEWKTNCINKYLSINYITSFKEEK